MSEGLVAALAIIALIVAGIAIFFVLTGSSLFSAGEETVARLDPKREKIGFGGTATG